MFGRLRHTRTVTTLALCLALVLLTGLAAPAAAACRMACCAPAPAGTNAGHAPGHLAMAGQDPLPAAAPSTALSGPGCCCQSDRDDCGSNLDAADTRPRPALERIVRGVVQIALAANDSARTEAAPVAQFTPPQPTAISPPRGGPVWLLTLSLLI